ncbi:MAG: class I SAM-dependent methyltransferase [Ramlibacter sp.]|nr:class I SAM-dependent methyltransferase [Ramlibacter sp.]
MIYSRRESQAEVARYYTEKINRYGPTPLGVDWSCEPTQELRFVQLLKVIGNLSASFSINDLGCGYGALLPFLRRRFQGRDINYVGVDLCEAMIRQARTLWSDATNAEFRVGDRLHRLADYSIASGTFNVKLDQTDVTWTRHVRTALTHMRSMSRYGYAANFLMQSESATDHPTELYFTRPEVWMTFCTEELQSSMTLIPNYGMREFTVIGSIQP